MEKSAIREMKVVDADSHVIEPPDLWRSRMSSKWGDLIPHVRRDSSRAVHTVLGPNDPPPPVADTWFVGDTPLFKAGAAAMAGWHEHAPQHPLTFDEFNPYSTDPSLRLKQMDEYGIESAVLYPNLNMFVSASYLGPQVDASLRLETVQAYNDYIAEEWIAVAPGRYIGMANLPFWDIEATKAEIERCASLGHKGLIFSQHPENYGLPPLDNKHWDSLCAAAQDAEMPINFHIGGGGTLAGVAAGEPENGSAANYAWNSVLLYPANMRTIGALIFGGICHRFPRLNFVSVESGIGWIPPVLEAMDWQFGNCGVRVQHPEYDLLPSEYFKRQIYGCFWFERASALAAIDILGPDNFLYETDFPHPTSMTPGPASIAQNPLDYMHDTLGHLPAETLAKILHNNAARIYHLDPVPAG